VVGDIWQDAGDLDTFVAQTKTTFQLDDHEPFDEMRFGTALGDVTTIPEPAALGMIGLASGAILFIRRRFMI